MEYDGTPFGEAVDFAKELIAAASRVRGDEDELTVLLNSIFIRSKKCRMVLWTSKKSTRNL
jgi:hypothetical protein